MLIMVEDNGVGMPEVQYKELLDDRPKSKGVGLQNIVLHKDGPLLDFVQRQAIIYYQRIHYTFEEQPKQQ